MSSPPQQAHLSNHHRSTLRRIFQHPAGHNIEWRAVLSLAEAVGSADEQPSGKVVVTIGSQTTYFDPPRHKDIDTQAVVNLRQMLTEVGLGARATDTRASRPRAWRGARPSRWRRRQPPTAQTVHPGGIGRSLPGSLTEDSGD